MLTRNVTSTRQRVCTSLKHILFFLTLYFCLVYFVSKHSSLDPSSSFFDATRAYEPRYSVERTRQAEAFIKSAWLKSKTSLLEQGSTTPQICIGIASTTHKRARSLRTTIGSILQGLSKEERDKLHLKVLIAHLDPLVHPAVHEPWLGHTVDDVLFYNETLSPKEIVRIVDLEKSSEFRAEAVREKEVFDYAFLLRRCFETGAEYVVLLEDDVVAMDGWLHRSLEALEEAEEKVALSDDGADFLSLRLFYTEHSQVWTPEDQRIHFFISLFLMGFLAAILYTTRRLAPYSAIGRNVTPLSIFWICCVVTPLLLLLYFSAGRVMMHPLPDGIMKVHGHEDGGRLYPSPGLVYPRHQVENLLAWFEEEKRVGKVGELIEEFAETKELQQWSVVPSVLQNVGRKDADGGEDDGEEVEGEERKLRSIAFEQNDVLGLKREHEEVLEGKKEGRGRVRSRGREVG